MIIFKTTSDKQVAISANNVIAVEEHPENPEVSVITHIMNRNSRKTHMLAVKHPIQEVVDAVNKVDSFI